jgi:hypothetical protein
MIKLKLYYPLPRSVIVSIELKVSSFFYIIRFINEYRIINMIRSGTNWELRLVKDKKLI